MAEETCCPEFDPAPWDDKTVEWKNKKFVKAKVRSLFYIPLNFGSVMRKLMKLIEAGGADTSEYMGLSDHTSPWSIDMYVAVDREIPGADNTTLSGRFYTKVYEGPFKDTKSWCKDFEVVAAGKGLDVKKWYMWYTVCPKCAKKYGKNYVVIVGQVA